MESRSAAQNVYATSIDAAWVELMIRLRQSPARESRVGPCSETIGCTVHVENPEFRVLDTVVRRLDPSFAAAETLWYLGGLDDVQFLLPYAPSYARFVGTNGSTWGAYGPRLRLTKEQMRETSRMGGPASRPNTEHTILTLLVEELRRSPDSRRAVAPIFRTDDVVRYMTRDESDVPCTIGLQFLLRDGALHCVAYMRSNDAWIGFPNDVFAFATIQDLVAQELGVRLGSYTHVAGSMHAYAKDLARHDLSALLGVREAMEDDPRDPADFSYLPCTDLHQDLCTALDVAIHCSRGELGDALMMLLLIEKGTIPYDLAAACYLKWRWDNLVFDAVMHPTIKHLLWQANEAKERKETT